MTATQQSPAAQEGEAVPAIVVHDEISVEFLLDSGALIRGRPHRNSVTLDARALPSIAEEARPALALGTRTYPDEAGAVRFALRAGAPLVERRPGSLRISRRRREVTVVAQSPDFVWSLVRLLDGSRSTADVLAALPEEERSRGAHLLADLAAAEVITTAGGATRRFLHNTTKRGALPLGPIGPQGIWELVSDGNYRSYPDAPRVPLERPVPDPLAPFHGLTRRRRSYRDFTGAPLTREQLDALLHTACGVTGLVEGEGRSVYLRAHPAGGALYAVEVYPVVFAVEGLAPAVYHYRPVEHALEVVRPGIDRAPFLDAALPEERPMITGVAVMFCLAGHFPRFERKYGEGSYRMLAAEAGHISQNIILAATALGLDTRPWGGVFDDMLNDALGLTTDDEQWLLSVLVGHAEGKIPYVHPVS